MGYSDKNLPDVQFLKVEMDLGPKAFPHEEQGQPVLTAWGEISISVQEFLLLSCIFQAALVLVPDSVLHGTSS